jgi:hypothetical protein
VGTLGVLAVSVYDPAVALAVNAGAVATPAPLVVAVAVNTPPKVPLAPPEGAVKVTVAPLTAAPPLAVTVAWNAVVNAVLTVALCGVPALATIAPTATAVLVRLKLAVVATLGVLAVTAYDPAVALAVKVGAIATPLPLVVAVAVNTPPKVPLAPPEGAVNVTVAPLTGLPPLVTVACSVAANAVLTIALWPDPPLAVMAVVGALAPWSAAPLKVTFTFPDVITQLTFNVWPADPAL